MLFYNFIICALLLGELEILEHMDKLRTGKIQPEPPKEVKVCGSFVIFCQIISTPISNLNTISLTFVLLVLNNENNPRT